MNEQDKPFEGDKDFVEPAWMREWSDAKEEDRPLLGSEYDEEFDQATWKDAAEEPSTFETGTSDWYVKRGTTPEPAEPQILIEETFFNRDKGHRFATERQTVFVSSRGELFRLMQQEHGCCTGKVYIDKKNGDTEEIGWVFIKRDTYSDCDDIYLLETWVTILQETNIDG